MHAAILATAFAGTVHVTASPQPDRKPQFTKPEHAPRLARHLTHAFRGFNERNTSSGTGVTIVWLKDSDEKFNLYCKDVVGNDYDGCYDGSADCRISAVGHTSKTATQKGKVATFAERTVGIVLSQELVENHFGKCAYVYDGGSNNRYNHGCGGGSKSVQCDDPSSAFQNVCPSSGKTCTAEDAEVESHACDAVGGHADAKNRRGCFYKLPAYDVRKHDILTHYRGSGPTWDQPSELHTMLSDRVRIDSHYDCDEDQMCWNEVVVDTRLLLTQLWWDPLTAVPGIVYRSGGHAHARRIQAAFKKSWGAEPTLLHMRADCNISDMGCPMFAAPKAAAPETMLV